MSHPILKEKVHSLSLNIRAHYDAYLKGDYPVAVTDDGFAIVRADELAALLADLNQLIDMYVPARAGRNSQAYGRSLEIVMLRDDLLGQN